MENKFVTAVCQGNEAAVRTSLARGADPNSKYRGRTVLLWAIQEGFTSVVEALISAGATVDLADDDGFTPLYQASAEGCLAIIQQLLAAGADVNRTTPHGSPLLLAFAYEHVEAARTLIAAGADPFVVDSDGMTPARSASDNKNSELLKLLDEIRK